MSLPTVVFIDTSIFAGQHYNFVSTAFSTFLPIARQRNITLVLPDPTEREIRRQIVERSEVAVKALDEVRRRAPFLVKWQHFPKRITGDLYSEWEIKKIASTELAEFFGHFKVVKLGYDNINLSTIMNWYDEKTPPFGEGRKRKEFPDAFAIAMLENYGETNDLHIAVVSADEDFRAACERFQYLLHFNSLPKLTELYLSETKNVSLLKQRLSNNLSELEAAIESICADSSTNYAHNADDVFVDGTEIIKARVDDLNVVALGGDECTVTFNANLTAEHHLIWSHYGTDGLPEEHDALVTDTHSVSGTAKVGFNDEGTISSVSFIELDDPIIFVDAAPD